MRDGVVGIAGVRIYGTRCQDWGDGVARRLCFSGLFDEVTLGWVSVYLLYPLAYRVGWLQVG